MCFGVGARMLQRALWRGLVLLHLHLVCNLLQLALRVCWSGGFMFQTLDSGVYAGSLASRVERRDDNLLHQAQTLPYLQ